MAAQSENFSSVYRQFEDRFRGSREVIKKRLSIYLPLLESTAEHLKDDTLALDLGCGRGEWLELLSENGWRAVGVELNEGMAQAAGEHSPAIVNADILQYLRDQQDASAGIISAFHVVEHLSIDYLIELLHECHRVLKDTGILILETPNPENITVGTWSFHLDPSHNKPLPPQLLQFFVQASGFKTTAVARLNGTNPAPEEGALELFARTLLEASMDYSVIAQKEASAVAIDPGIVQSFANAVSQNNPANTVDLKTLLKGTDNQIATSQQRLRRQEANQEILRTKLELGFNQQRSSQAELRAEMQEELRRQKIEQANLRAELTEAKKEQVEMAAKLALLYTSASWRITAPLRNAKRSLLSLSQAPSKVFRFLARQFSRG